MSIRYAITFKNMINVYKIVRYSQINVYLISIVFTKFFDLIPMSKKSTEFFQFVRIFPAVFAQIFGKVIWEHWFRLIFLSEVSKVLEILSRLRKILENV